MPPRNNTRPDGSACSHTVLQRDLEPGRVQTEGRPDGLPRIRPVEVGRGPHADNAREVDETRASPVYERFQGRVVFLLRGAVCRRAIREEGRRIRNRLPKQVALPEHVGRGGVASDDGWGRGRSCVCGVVSVVCALLLSMLVVRERSPLRECHCQLAEVVVELEDLGAIDVLGVHPGERDALREVTSGEVGRHLARVDLALQSHLYSKAREGDTAEGALLGVDACYAGDEAVRALEVEGGGVDEGGDR